MGPKAEGPPPEAPWARSQRDSEHPPKRLPLTYHLGMSAEYLIKQYGLQQGALEIQYIEEFFLDFPRKKRPPK